MLVNNSSLTLNHGNGLINIEQCNDYYGGLEIIKPGFGAGLITSVQNGHEIVGVVFHCLGSDLTYTEVGYACQVGVSGW